MNVIIEVNICKDSNEPSMKEKVRQTQNYFGEITKSSQENQVLSLNFMGRAFVKQQSSANTN